MLPGESSCWPSRSRIATPSTTDMWAGAWPCQAGGSSAESAGLAEADGEGGYCCAYACAAEARSASTEKTAVKWNALTEPMIEPRWGAGRSPVCGWQPRRQVARAIIAPTVLLDLPVRDLSS